VPAPLHVITLFHTPAPVQIMNVFDTNGDGEVDFQEFRDIVGKLLLPGAMMLRFYLSLRHLGCAASAARGTGALISCGPRMWIQMRAPECARIFSRRRR
jgi:hypothetical protein